MSIIRSVEELKALYGEPAEAALVKVCAGIIPWTTPRRIV